MTAIFDLEDAWNWRRTKILGIDEHPTDQNNPESCCINHEAKAVLGRTVAYNIPRGLP
jgi:hypothetical protein